MDQLQHIVSLLTAIVGLAVASVSLRQTLRNRRDIKANERAISERMDVVERRGGEERRSGDDRRGGYDRRTFGRRVDDPEIPGDPG